MEAPLTTDQKGNVAEAAVALHAIRLGIEVYRPDGEGGRFDMIFVFHDGSVSRVQCKWASRQDEVITLRAYSARRTATGLIRRLYTAEEIDAFAIYCPELDRVYYVPVGELDGQQQFCLRLAPTKNGQRGAIHWATDYELGAVAQLGEHLHGMQGVVGSSPISSTPPAGGPTTVGSDEFRDRMGWYCDRVMAGEELLVTRRGKPRFRIVPV